MLPVDAVPWKTGLSIYRNTLEDSVSHIHTFGDYGFKPMVSAFHADLSAIPISEPMFGLPLQIQHLYGFLETEDGMMYSPARKFNGSLTGGLFFMAYDGKTLELHPGTGGGARGELRRNMSDPGRRKWSNPIFYNLPEGVTRPGELDLLLELHDNEMIYEEGELFDLTGVVQPLGLQHYTPMRDRALFYASLCYSVTGTVLGKKAAGVLFFENAYWKHGIEWKDYDYYAQEQVGWQIFGNTLEDGTIQWGIILQGAEGFTQSIILEADEVVAVSNETANEFDLDDNGFVRKVRSDIDGQIWEFISTEKGYKKSFSNARLANYLSQLGRTRRVGDERAVKRGYTLFQHFPARIVKAGLNKKLD
ncbi:hypothetical protein KO481_42460 [Nocardia sp. NEAU-G5]|uniref:Uncharacterized protein n=1 Tax=Nocardia albiluteola TaxID=2842303 RepID=A0ABS6BD04_9NOCA|nr:hypothetical protein [Nocardia albiluteola]MBU3068167.1 hypothetical protein [Nocardia albiluteola]